MNMKSLRIHIAAIQSSVYSSFIVLALGFGTLALLDPAAFAGITPQGFGLGMWRLLLAATILAALRHAYRLIATAEDGVPGTPSR